MNLKEIDLKTPRQRRSERLHSAVCKDYANLRRDNPSVSNHRIMLALATAHELTREGIRKILIEGGLYRPAKRNTNGTTD